MSGIIYADYYMPETGLPVWEFLKCSNFVHARDEDFCECYISQSRQELIHIEKQKDPIEIFDILLKKYFRQNGPPGEEITHLIYTSLDNWEKNDIYVPYYLLDKYQLKNASITGMVQECVTVLQALQMAAALVDSGQAKNVMILSICHGRSMENRYTGSTVVGDGAGMMVVGNTNCASQIVCCNSLSNGRYSFDKYHKIPPKISGMDIAKIGADFIGNLLKTSGMTLGDIRMMVPQNINYSEYHLYTQYLGIGMDQIYTRNIAKGGHWAEVDTIRNYTDITAQLSPGPGEQFLLYGSGTIGAGMDSVYNGVVIRFL